MASFQAKIGWKRPRKRKNKNCLSIPVLPDGQQKIPKKEKKNQKIKKYHCGFIRSQNRLEKAKELRKKKSSFRFVPTRPVIENSKKISKKMKKMTKIHYGVISRQNRLEKANEVRKKKLSFRFVPFRPDA